jgi:hypothetical protein
MKKTIIFLIIIFLFNIRLVALNKYGIGIILGEPSGINFEIDMRNNSQKSNSIEFATNFNTAEKYFYFHCDYLIKDHKYVPKKDLTGRIPIFYGFGIKYVTYNSNTTHNIFGIRTVFGVEYIFDEIPFNIFAMLSPVIEISPETSLYLSPSFGVRYFFN